jgi:hypothetical protein
MKKPPLPPQLSRVSEELESFAADLRGWIRSGLAQVTGARNRSLAAGFASWVESEVKPEVDRDGVEQLRLWVADLDLQGREALAQQVADFCDAFDIDLAWIVDGELRKWTQLNALLSTMIIRYCLACKAAVDADDPLRQFRHRRVWSRKLKTRTRPNTSAASDSAG